MGEDIAINAKIWTIGGFSSHAGQSEIIDWLGKFVTPRTRIFLVHGEEKAQLELSAILEEKFQAKVYIPAYLEEQELEPEGFVVVEAVPGVDPAQRVDWELLLGDTEQKVVMLRKKIEEVSHRPLVEQVAARDRVLELNRDLLATLSQI